MKVKATKKQPQGFVPVEVTFTCETQEDLDRLACVLNQEGISQFARWGYAVEELVDAGADARTLFDELEDTIVHDLNEG